jgi:long-chain acyl-CoA synthetase
MRLQRLFSDLGSMVRIASWQYNRGVAFTACLPRGISGSLTFSEVDEYSALFALYLTEVLGLRKGERVALQLPNCLAWPVCAFGVLRAGLILTSLNPHISDKHLHECLRESGARLLITGDIFVERLERAVSHTAVRTVVTANVADFFPVWAKLLVQGDLRMKGWLRKRQGTCVRLVDVLEKAFELGRWFDGAENFSPLTHDVAAFLQTNGTSGRPRVVMLTHSNLAANVAQVVRSLDERVVHGREVVFTPLPFHNSFAFTTNLLAFWWLGAHQILVPYPRPYSNLRKAFERNNITWLVGANPFFRNLVREPWFIESPPRRLKGSLAVGMPLDRDLVDDFSFLTGAPLWGGYGMAEAGALVSMNALDIRGAEELHAGFPLLDTEVVVLDSRGRVLPPGGQGEIAVRGPQVMLGYWNEPDETARALAGGWLRTGDWGMLGEDGAVIVIERMSRRDHVSSAPSHEVSEPLKESMPSLSLS